MNKVIENVFFLKIVTSFGETKVATFTVAPLFYNVQRQQIYKLIKENLHKVWSGAVLYIGMSDYSRGAVWTFGSLSDYLVTLEDLSNPKTLIFNEEYFNGFC